MMIDIQATDDELIAKADVLLAYVADLRDEALARRGDDDLEKAARLTIKDHPKVALTQLRRQWVTGYRDQMEAMNAEIGQFLETTDIGDEPA